MTPEDETDAEGSEGVEAADADRIREELDQAIHQSAAMLTPK
jgi:hypothetical protein